MNKRDAFWDLLGMLDDALSEINIDVERSAGRVVVDVHTGDWRRRLRAWWDGVRQTEEQAWQAALVEDAERRLGNSHGALSLVGRHVRVEDMGHGVVMGPVYGLPGWFVVLVSGEWRSVRQSQIWVTT